MMLKPPATPSRCAVLDWEEAGLLETLDTLHGAGGAWRAQHAHVVHSTCLVLGAGLDLQGCAPPKC